jgi:predicted dehydrogenase
MHLLFNIRRIGLLLVLLLAMPAVWAHTTVDETFPADGDTVTGTPEKAVQWMEEYGIPEANVYDYDSYDEIASNPDIDIVYIVLPNSMHAEYTIRAAEAGKHVIVEKPPVQAFDRTIRP